MWGSKKPKPPPVALSRRVEHVVAAEPARVQDQLRGTNSEHGLINDLVDRLPEDDQVVALCMGGPGEFGVQGPGYGVFVLTNRELLWRNKFGQTLDIALQDVQQIHTTMVSQYCVYMELVTHGGHRDALAFSQSEHSSGRQLSEALDAAVRSARESKASPAESSTASVADELEKLDALRQRGVLTAEEFASQKRALLGL